MRRRLGAGFLLIFLLGGMAFLLQAGAAAKFVGLTCSYVEAGPPGPPGNVLRIDGSQAEEDALALRRAGDAIEVVDISRVANQNNLTSKGEVLRCEGGTPTVTNVDSIRYLSGVNVGPSLQLDERGGAFAPGASDEGDGSSEIEISFDRLSNLIVAGTKGPDDVIVGRIGNHLAFDLNAAESKPDVDLRVPLHLEAIDLLGLGGADRLSDAGGKGLAPTPFVQGVDRANGLIGGKGDDLLIGGRGSDALLGGPGADVLRAGPGFDALAPGGGRDRAFAGSGSDQIFAKDGSRDRVDCGAGLDFARADDRDALKSCEDFPPGGPAA